MASPIGTKINELRRGKKMTLDDLAQATGSSKSYMWEIENKDVARPSAEKLDRIAVALGVTADYLIGPSAAPPSDDVHDRAFYRKFQNANPHIKDKLKRILDVLDEDS